MKKGEVILLAIALALTQIALTSAYPAIVLEKTGFLACENQPFSLQFQIADENPEALTIDVSPKNPFFSQKLSDTTGELFSSELTKQQAGQTHNLILTLSNSVSLDTKTVSIEVIETNNAPEIKDIEVKTVSLDQNQNFGLQVEAADAEETELSYVLNFISGEKIFDISPDGKIEAALTNEEIGIYQIEVCAQDQGLSSLHPEADFCNEYGDQKLSCSTFELTITESNTPPTISSSTPQVKDLVFQVGNELSFSIETFDPDGTTPQVYWYLNSEFERRGEKTFTKTFGCDEIGSHSIRAEITDGLTNDSVVWTINTEENPLCTEEKLCDGKWACDDWNICQTVENSPTLNEADRQFILAACAEQAIPSEFCGFQIRTCTDINACDDPAKPEELQVCQFTSAPSCQDNLQNCHDNLCETSRDCGGPCQPCTTCSDGIQNQNEEGVDCGGSCDTACPTRQSILRSKLAFYGAIAVLSVLVIIMVMKIVHVLFMQNQLKKIGKLK